jgi:uncharacterized metal-binding protein YceD (DUF177 family)
MSNNDLYYLNKAKGTMETDSGEVILHEDDQEIDISEQIRQELMLNLPMKRIAPEYRDKTIEELYPEFLDSNQNNSQIDERWKGLEGLTLEN